jgi:hypothetical protein
VFPRAARDALRLFCFRKTRLYLKQNTAIPETAFQCIGTFLFYIQNNNRQDVTFRETETVSR